MIRSTVYKPVAVLLATSVLLVGGAQLASAGTLPPSATTASDVDELAVDRALGSVVTVENVDGLLAAARANGDTETVHALDGVRAELVTVLSEKSELGGSSVANQDIIDTIKRIAKFAQPIVVAALRIGGPLAAQILDTIGNALRFIPGLGGVISSGVLKTVALGVREGAEALAALIESIKIEGLSQAEARDALAGQLRQLTDAPADQVAAAATVLAVVATA
ncbi:hypothetical protein SAMN05421810_104112 [Amycolatopsis arida]|uniref:Uncharacterized protein n=1 Tax=Amycolatopsis arida TaxID=587909 RepID=A0A1I5UTU5_9PSEU|nr:hypothetical protein [Amycolatopsis arida]TDX91032.1 hypothetical protein CLV69_106111 [Amycolatopsis arida]SFP98695.1 hypothetical protein SAMN05421810_104112 [Amycolatopsis arida]